MFELRSLTRREEKKRGGGGGKTKKIPYGRRKEERHW